MMRSLAPMIALPAVSNERAAQVPLPVGTADVRLEGGNKVIDALIKLGVMTEEDAMGARMMMAMFGQPAGDDVLTSKIEAREGGSIFVNGQQIQ